jgi:hypothetical protein
MRDLLEKEVPKRKKGETLMDQAEQKGEAFKLVPVEGEAEEETLIKFKHQLQADLLAQSLDGQWYELYKNITNEKDIARKDEERLMRRTRRRLRRRQKLKNERMSRIDRTLAIRRDFRSKNHLKMKSTSVDRYHDYTDKDYERSLIKEHVELRKQLMIQQRNQANLEDVLLGLATVKVLLEAAGAGQEGNQGWEGNNVGVQTEVNIAQTMQRQQMQL